LVVGFIKPGEAEGENKKEAQSRQGPEEVPGVKIPNLTRSPNGVMKPPGGSVKSMWFVTSGFRLHRPR
jgi:hypothetical protein